MTVIDTYTEDEIRTATGQTPGVLVRIQDACLSVRVDGLLIVNADGGLLHVTPDEEGEQYVREVIASLEEEYDRLNQLLLDKGRLNSLDDVKPFGAELVQLEQPCWVVSCAACGDLYGGEAGWHLLPETADVQLTKYGWRRLDGLWTCDRHFDDVERDPWAPVPAPRVWVEQDPRRYLRRKGLARLLVLLGALVTLTPAVSLALQGEPRAAAIATWFGTVALLVWIRFVYLPRFKRGAGRRWLR